MADALGSGGVGVAGRAGASLAAGLAEGLFPPGVLVTTLLAPWALVVGAGVLVAAALVAAPAVGFAAVCLAAGVLGGAALAGALVAAALVADDLGAGALAAGALAAGALARSVRGASPLLDGDLADEAREAAFDAWVLVAALAAPVPALAGADRPAPGAFAPAALEGAGLAASWAFADPAAGCALRAAPDAAARFGSGLAGLLVKVTFFGVCPDAFRWDPAGAAEALRPAAFASRDRAEETTRRAAEPAEGAASLREAAGLPGRAMYEVSLS